ncbi:MULTISPECIES: hypothetical protein [Lactobacillus]|uniref:Uncharacterized protein n=3 Tax=Lactobacillus TaxID=1578 RepID=A0AAN5W8H1_9LACO|nr:MULTISPECIES: hypothetical protein [Lactobacillus]KAA8780408.1 hypothetical protein F1C01_00115 [Lactobacillus crispatus]KAA8791839.1 hypothetical protein F1B99_09490 [Lactobacillus crispatus]KAA8795806.1 hypothetical protein F1B96_09455 [Lactobacillus crispatus]KAA8796240.1 hypothetical protein F1C02_10215 [Lactobacillus crispatus]KAA8800329.1 hypothetical protein F1C03_08510 [Lactobacillus crispatus]
MHIRQVKFSISLFLLAFVIFLFTLKGFTTTVLADEDTTVETVATYNYNKVPADTLATIKDIVANDNTISMKVKDGYLILTKVYSNSPELENNPLESSFVQLPGHSANVKVVNFNLALAKMDAGNALENIPNGSPLFIYGQEAYAGQRNGQHVSVGTHVHCNRFNGKHSDHKYWKHSDPRSWVDFIGSDCDYHAPKYNCNMYGRNVKCDGLNTKGHGVHNCSSWKGGRAHKNWPKTCWYRN